MNIYNTLSDSYYHSLTFLQYYFDYTKETKVKRLATIIDYINQFIYNFTQDNNKIGNILILINILFIIILIILYIFIPVNNFTIALIIGIGITHLFTNRYFGPSGCVLARLERYYYNNKNWFGPFTLMFLFLHVEPSRFNMDLFLFIMSGIIIINYLYRVHKFYIKLK